MPEKKEEKVRFLDPIIEASTPMPISDYISSYLMNGDIRIAWFGSNRMLEEFLAGRLTPSEAVESEYNIALPTHPTVVLNMNPSNAVLLLEHLVRQLQNIELPEVSPVPSYKCAACRLPAPLRELADKLENIAKKNKNEFDCDTE